MSWEEEVNRDTEHLVQDKRDVGWFNDTGFEDDCVYGNDDAALKAPRVGLYWERVEEKFQDFFQDDESDGIILRRTTPEAAHYAPDRGPPIVDFLSVFAAFIVAVIAAYYSIM